jgi:Flp pilus assembly protein TadG
MMTRQRRKNSQRRGAAAVEFAVCLPVLLAFVFGILEFSRATQLQQSTRLAAFEGARAGITLDAASSDVTTAVNRVMSAVSISNFSTTVSPSPLTYTSPTVTVTVNLDPTQNAWFTWFIRSNNTISSSVTLSREVNSVSVP